MANATADIQRLLVELVQVTTKIAALVNSTGIDASDDSDSLTSTANRLALSASIIAVGAFFIATLQALLEYASAGEPARRKCNPAAIGPFSKYVHKTWSFRHWRRKFYYPVLRSDIFFAIYTSTSVKLPNTEGDNQVLTRIKRLVASRRQVPNLQSRPRATWAQLLSLNGIEDDWALTTNTYVDVDSIPGPLDVPPQMVDLAELARLVVFMGCDSVRMSVQDRDFRAVGGFGSITTEELAGYGKVLRFQKYDKKWNTGVLQPMVAPHPLSWHSDAWNLMKGMFDIDAHEIGKALKGQRDSRGSISTSNLGDMKGEADRMLLALKETIQQEAGNIHLDDVYERVKAMPNEITHRVFTQWQPLGSKNSIGYPKILITLAIAGLPCAATGFPGRSFLTPFLGQCRQISQGVYKQYENAVPDVPFGDHHILRSFDYLDMMKKSRSFSPLALKGQSHWAFEATGFLEMNYKIRPYLNIIREWASSETEPSKGQCRQWRVILAPIASLLKNYDLRVWAQSFRAREQPHLTHSPNTNIHDPADLLKTQIILLDVSIQCLLNAMWKRYASHMPFVEALHTRKLFSPGTFVFQVVAAITNSTAYGEVYQAQLFDGLDLALPNESATNVAATAEYQEKVSQLAGFLRLRLVLYAAYLMIIPDTSDILDAILSVGRDGFMLPMI